jgi:DNA topoisomerase III
MVVRVLNVAEKPSVAKSISAILSNNSTNRRNGLSKYNHIWEFTFNHQHNIPGCDNQSVHMIFTSVSGHLMQLEYKPAIQWHMNTLEQLFTAPVSKEINSSGTNNQNENIKKTIEKEARTCDKLILWLDCDREGENIAYEVYDVCRAVNPRFNQSSNVQRAHFSALIPADIYQAMRTLTPPNQYWSYAVDTRSELDLRLGAVFTRLQTLKFKQKHHLQHLTAISWGPCQFPTLGMYCIAWMLLLSCVL